MIIRILSLSHCVFCDGTNHKSANCRKHPDYDTRIDLLKQKHLCLLCLKAGHMKKDCRSRIICNSCKMKHHESLCSNICGFSKRKQACNNSSVPKIILKIAPIIPILVLINRKMFQSPNRVPLVLIL